MNTTTAKLRPYGTLRRILSMLLVTLGLVRADAQTSFAPNNVYNNWNSSTQVFATVPTAPGFTFSQIARGSGLTSPATVTSGITSTGWNGPTSEAAATAANKFFFFSIATTTCSFTITDLNLALQRSSTGPGDFQVTYSINGGPFSPFGSPFSSSVNGAFSQTVSDVIPAVNPGENIVFRLVGWNSSNVAGTMRINNTTAVGGTYTCPSTTSLSTTTIGGAPFCVSAANGAAATVGYSGSGVFSSGNVFSAELSNASGSFASPVTIGSLSSTALTGTINATIPAGTALGTGYRIRVVASSPSTTGTDNGADLSVVQGVSATHTVTNVNCNGNTNGAVTTTITQGVTPYTFAWSNTATTQNLSNLSAGTYSVTITSGNGCTTTISNVTVTQPAAINATATPTNVLCNGGTNGSVNLAVNGGITPYTYAWSNSASTQNLSNIGAGSYSVIITDNNGCTRTASVTVTAPTAITHTVTPTNVLCNGGTNGSVNLAVNGGITPYTYAWSNSTSAQNLSNIGAGSYSVIITDNNGCTHTASATVTAPAAITATATATDVLCNGGSDGAVNLAVNGGITPYTYAWSNSASTQNLSSIGFGSYSVTITDNNGCTHTASATVTAPAAITATATATDVLCNGGSDGAVNLAVNGGITPYTYAWSNSASTQNLSSIGFGSYSVTITDNNGCTHTASASVTQPAAITATATVTDILCNGGNSGSVNLSVNGGTLPYTYLWSNSATTQNLSNVDADSYSVTITDNHGCTHTASATVTEPNAITASASPTNVPCNGDITGAITLTVNGGEMPYTYLWNNSATTQDIFGIGAGSYSVTITDANGCTHTASSTVAEPSLINSSITSTAVLCHGDSNGSVGISVSGGTPSYTFEWDNNATTQNIANLAAGTYSVTITDVNGCTATASATVTQPAAISSAITSTDASCSSCADGSADLTVTGGTAPYTYLWSNSATSEDLTNVAPGTYTVTITDDNGCQWTDSVLVDFSLAVNEMNNTMTVNVYPNPSADGNVRVQLSGNFTGTVSFVLFDLAGKEVYSETLTATNVYTIALPVTNGTYFYTLFNNGAPVRSERLIIAK